MSNREHLDKVKEALSAVSPSFCLAKWTQVSIHLQNGTTHSCHHPKVHKIPLDLLRENPAVLHNTPQKIQEREAMLKGERPEGCNYCWRVEDTPGDNISDRIIKSSFSWSLPEYQKIKNNPLDTNFTPNYVEINLGDICNFKCSYCSPDVSTAWMAEIKKFGTYPTSGNHPYLDPEFAPIPGNQENPFREAFWKWWPDLYPNLHTFRVTGGEPLLNKDLDKVLDWIQENPNPNLVFAINTNLCPPEELWQNFLLKLKKISDGKFVKKLEIYTSAEAWGPQAEYIRHGMNFELWRKRLWDLLEQVPRAHVTIMATYNALSVLSFERLLEEVIKIKSTEHLYNPDRLVPVFIDISFLRYPSHQTIKILPPQFVSYMQAQLDYMVAHPETYLPETKKYKRGFLPFEIDKMARIVNWFRSDQDELDKPETKQTLQIDFYKFFTEHDRRRNTHFLETFPELKEFWQFCIDSNVKKKLNKYVCTQPFVYLDIQEDSQWLCCPSWCPSNIRTSEDNPSGLNRPDQSEDFLKNWRSKNARAVRRSVMDGSYRHCDHKVCPSLSQLINTDVVPANFLIKEQIEKEYAVTTPEEAEEFSGLPETLLFGFDRSCNLKCPSCRPDIVHNTPAESADYQLKSYFLNSIENNLSSSLKNMVISGSGDPFYSRLFRNYLINFDATKYPKLECIKIVTNGNLLTEKMWNSLKARDFIKNIEISIDAGTKETYENVTRLGGKWEKLLENMAFLSKQETIEEMTFSMVVSQNNYKEMALFHDLICGIFANSKIKIQINYRQIVHWTAGAYTKEEHINISVFEQSHPEHTLFLEELGKVKDKPFVSHNFHHLFI
ncbi:MAG: twitch domain-containing radical SAM protein [Bdellovibrio sp.]|nr:twitch domain-containing radical SAM protein [Bdellovibrio sp.]